MFSRCFGSKIKFRFFLAKRRIKLLSLFGITVAGYFMKILSGYRNYRLISLTQKTLRTTVLRSLNVIWTYC